MTVEKPNRAVNFALEEQTTILQKYDEFKHRPKATLFLQQEPGGNADKKLQTLSMHNLVR